MHKLRVLLTTSSTELSYIWKVIAELNNCSGSSVGSRPLEGTSLTLRWRSERCAHAAACSLNYQIVSNNWMSTGARGERGTWFIFLAMQRMRICSTDRTARGLEKLLSAIRKCRMRTMVQSVCGIIASALYVLCGYRNTAQAQRTFY